MARHFAELDHLVFLTKDLENRATLYQRLGFNVEPYAYHGDEFGTGNRIILCGNMYLELLTYQEKEKPNQTIDQWMSVGEGLRALAFKTNRHLEAYNWLTEQGLAPTQPLHITRAVDENAAIKKHIRFSVVMLPFLPSQHLTYFLCQSDDETKEALQQTVDHPNGVRSVAAIYIIASCTKTSYDYLSKLFGTSQVTQDNEAVLVDTLNIKIWACSIDYATDHFPELLQNKDVSVGPFAIEFTVNDIQKTQIHLNQQNIGYGQSTDHIQVNDPTLGVTVIFSEQ